MAKVPLLSLITINRNDEYYKHQLPRIKFILNYFTYSIKKMDALSKVEYIFVDWGSNIPFANYFHEEISRCSAIKFIYVPKEETTKCELSFDVSKALNIGIENSLGEHVILLSGSDVFFPLSVFSNLLNILTKPEIYGLRGNEYKLIPRKFLEDDSIIYEKDMKKINLYLQKLNHYAFSFPNFPLNSGGGTGGNLLQKKQWLKIGGIKDTKKHNRGQDIVNFHEASKICSHIDTATFGTFLLKLPRNNLGTREMEVEQVQNPLDYLTFEKNRKVINYKNIKIINKLNPPNRKLNIYINKPQENVISISLREIIKTVIDCLSFKYFYGISLKSEDVQFILKMSQIIKNRKFKTLIFDEFQAARFATYLVRKFSDLQIIIFLDPKKYTSLDILKFRTALTYHLYERHPEYYGHIKVMEIIEGKVEFINKDQYDCIIQDYSSNHFSFFNKKIGTTKINAVRKFINNKNNIRYVIKGNMFYNKKDQKILLSNIFVNFIIYNLLALKFIKRMLGNLKRKF